MIKILYREDKDMSVVTKNMDDVLKFIMYTDLRQKLNLHRKINVYKINFESDKLTDEMIIHIFKTSNAKRRSELFGKLF